MSRAHDIAIKVTQEFLKRGKPFTYAQLKEEILGRGGILRTAPNYPLPDYLETLVYNRKLEKKGLYYVPATTTARG